MLEGITDINFETLFDAEKKSTETLPQKEKINTTVQPQKAAQNID